MGINNNDSSGYTPHNNTAISHRGGKEKVLGSGYEQSQQATIQAKTGAEGINRSALMDRSAMMDRGKQMQRSSYGSSIQMKAPDNNGKVNSIAPKASSKSGGGIPYEFDKVIRKENKGLSIPDHINPNQKIARTGKYADMTYKEVLDYLNPIYFQVMHENYIVREKGRHVFHRERWVQQHAKGYTVADVFGITATKAGLELRERGKKAEQKAISVINSKEYNVFFRNAPVVKKKTNNTQKDKDKDENGSFIVGRWFPVAVILTADGSASFGASISTEVGIVRILQGPDTGKHVGFSDLGIGGGINVPGINGKLGFIFWTGDIEDFKVDVIRGWRSECNAGISAIVELGLSVSIGKYDQKYEGRTITTSIYAGIAPSVVPVVEAETNFGRSFITK